MVGLILIVAVILLVLVCIGLASSEAPEGWIIASAVVAVIISVLVAVSFSIIPTVPHDAEYVDRSPAVVVDKVDRQGGVYIFTMEDGSQVAKGSDDVVESDTYGAEATIQYGNEYYSWGNFWFGEDWAGKEKVYYTPSNGG